MLPDKGNQQSSQGVTEQDSLALSRSSLFRQLFEADKNRLYSYIFAFVSNQAAADDIFQETCLTLWNEFESFTPGTNFSKWANVIAFNRVQKFRRTQEKYQLGLSEDFLHEFGENVAVMESNSDSHELEYKWKCLDTCLSLLAPPLKAIYQHFYIRNLTAQEISDNTGRSIHAIRKAIHKVRKKLFDCVDEQVEGL